MLAVQAANPGTLERYDVVHMDNNTQPLTLESCQLVKQSDVFVVRPTRCCLELLRPTGDSCYLFLVWETLGVCAVIGVQFASVLVRPTGYSFLGDFRKFDPESAFLRPDPFCVRCVIGRIPVAHALLAPA